MTGHARFYELIKEMVRIHDMKNADYANSNIDPLRNFRECEKFGVPAYLGTLVRMSDKWMRLCNLIAKGGIPTVKDEAVEDTATDLANYALIFRILWEEHKTKEKVKTSDPLTLAELQKLLQKKIGSHYSAFGFGDNRFTLQEYGFLCAALTKLLRIMFNDTKKKVPDDAIDVQGYMELFWKSFQGREQIPIRIRKELYR